MMGKAFTPSTIRTIARKPFHCRADTMKSLDRRADCNYTSYREREIQ